MSAIIPFPLRKWNAIVVIYKIDEFIPRKIFNRAKFVKNKSNAWKDRRVDPSFPSVVPVPLETRGKEDR